MNTKIFLIIGLLFLSLQGIGQVNPTAAIKPANGENYILISRDTFGAARFIYDSVRFDISGDTLYFTDSVRVDLSSVVDTVLEIATKYDLTQIQFNIDDFGAVAGGDSSLNTLAFQAAIDAASLRGGGTVVMGCGEYRFEVQGVNPYDGSHNYIIELKSNVLIEIPSCAIFKMANSQQQISRVDLIIFSDVENIGISGGGLITGNTANQAWAGGYEQTTGCIINSWGTNENVLIQNITLTDHFSNPLNLRGCNNSKFSNIKSSSTGEGQQWINCNKIFVSDIVHNDTLNVAVGDGFEFAGCENVIVDGFYIFSNGAGTGLDVFGCRDCHFSNGIIEGWSGGVEVDSGALYNPLRVTLNNILVQNVTDPSGGFQFNADSIDVTCINCVSENGNLGFQVNGDGGKQIGKVLLKNCIGSNNSNHGLQVATSTALRIQGGDFSNNTNNGILWVGQQSATIEADNYFEIDGSIITGNGGTGVFIQDNALGFNPHGFVNVWADGNGPLGSQRYSITEIVNVFYPTDFYITNERPIRTATQGDGMQHVAGEKVVYISSNLTNLEGGTDGQNIELIFTNPITISNAGNIRLKINESRDFSTTENLKLTFDANTNIWREQSANISKMYVDNGTAASPSYSFKSDSTSGFFNIATGRFGASVAGNFVSEYRRNGSSNIFTLFGNSNTIGSPNIFITKDAGSINTSLYYTGDVFEIENWESGVGYNQDIAIQKLGGNVGIGTITPDAKLDVDNGTVRFSDYGNGTVTGTPTKYLAVESDGDVIEVDIPTDENVYTHNGTLTANRIITSTGQSLEYSALDGNDINLSTFSDNGNTFAITDTGTGALSNLSQRPEYLKLTSAPMQLVNNDDYQLLWTDVETNSTTKNGGIGSFHYTNSEEPFLALVSQSGSSFNSIRFGGGDSGGNAATVIDFYTASNNTTTTGTRRMRINSSGNLGLGLVDPTDKLEVDGVVKINDFIKMVPTATVPTSPASGWIYFDDGTNRTGAGPRYYNGSSWVDL